MTGASFNKRLRFCQNYNTTVILISAPLQTSFMVDVLAMLSHVSWNLWTTHISHKLPMGFWCKKLPSSAPYCMLWQWQFLATYWGFLETEFPQALSPCPPYPVAHHRWDDRSSIQKLATATKGSFAIGQSQNGLLTYLITWGVASPVLSSLLDVMVLKEVTPPPDTLATWGEPLGINWWTAVGGCTLYRWCCHHHMWQKFTGELLLFIP